ncbi:hypothetical protein HZB60_03330 [candidate division KSB1 bacterium]|nr:hypothetical protein [candidate division KSB1 bacterium]
MWPFRTFSGLAALALTGLIVARGAAADLSLTGGGITLVVASATAGSHPDPASDNTCGLVWTKGVADPTQKITARTSLGGPAFVLTVEAQSVVQGTGTGLVTLTTTDADLVTDITSTLSGSALLYYEVSATAPQGSGTEEHTITYTITAQ